MDAICFSETSIDFQRTTRRYIPEDGTLGSIFIKKSAILSKFPALNDDCLANRQKNPQLLQISIQCLVHGNEIQNAVRKLAYIIWSFAFLITLQLTYFLILHIN
jgi:hypothetical protein